MTKLKDSWFAGTCGKGCSSCRRYIDEHKHVLSYLETRLPSAYFAVSVDQTGGHCMCIRVQLLNESRPETGYAWITDSEEREGRYMLGIYDSENDEEGRIFADVTTLRDAIRFLRDYHA